MSHTLRSGAEVIQDGYRRSSDRETPVRLALGCQDSVIGQWRPSLNRFYPIACQTLTQEWVSMPYEILANGHAPDYQWVEITRDESRHPTHSPGSQRRIVSGANKSSVEPWRRRVRS